MLEITERASLERVRDVRGRVVALRSCGFRITTDDLGSGYAGLTSFAVLEPDIVKLDMSLARDVDQNPVKPKIHLETPAERDVLTELGCDLLQGFLFARPRPPFPHARW